MSSKLVGFRKGKILNVKKMKAGGGNLKRRGTFILKRKKAILRGDE